MTEGREKTIGAVPEAGGVRFRVWAPEAGRVEVVVEGGKAHPLEKDPEGYHSAHVRSARPGTRYRYRLDGDQVYPDPASRSQPDGVHGASEVVDLGAFRWTDGGWKGLDPDELIIYE